MEIYTLKLVLEPDEDSDGNPSGWHAYGEGLEGFGLSTWGKTRTEALRHIGEVLALIADEIVDEGKLSPAHVPEPGIG